MNFNHTHKVFKTLFTFFVLVFTFVNLGFSQKPPKQYPKVSTTDLKPIVSSVASSSLKVVSDGIIIDTNRDGIEDIAVIVNLVKPRPEGIIDLKNVPKLKLQYLCGNGGENNCADEIEFANPVLLVIHGKNKGWNLKGISNFKPLNSILFRGRSNIHAFQKDKYPTNEELFEIFKYKFGIGFKLSTEAL